MRFLFALGLAALLGGSLLSGCAPTPSSTSTAPAGHSTPGDPARPTFRAAFSPAGVAWLRGTQACVARAPSFQAVCPRLGRVTDVAWNGGNAWAAVPGLGLIVTLDLAARTVPVGAVVALSSLHIYREDGSALTYAGQPDGGVPGTPVRAITGGDGQEYVLLAGRVMRVADQTVSEVGTPASPLGETDLIAAPGGVLRVAVPTAYGNDSVYRLQGGLLERADLTGRVLGRVPHASGAAVGLVGEQVVTVTPAGEIRRFKRDLQEIH